MQLPLQLAMKKMGEMLSMCKKEWIVAYCIIFHSISVKYAML